VLEPEGVGTNSTTSPPSRLHRRPPTAPSLPPPPQLKAVPPVLSAVHQVSNSFTPVLFFYLIFCCFLAFCFPLSCLSLSFFLVVPNLCVPSYLYSFFAFILSVPSLLLFFILCSFKLAKLGNRCFFIFGLLDVLFGGRKIFSVTEKAFIKNTNLDLDPKSPVQ
jgi:hypothetical protein